MVETDAVRRPLLFGTAASGRAEVDTVSVRRR
jgi:hypothetical protein